MCPLLVRRPLLALATVPLLMASWCLDSGSGCYVTEKNDMFRQHGYTMIVTEPSGCPVSIDQPADLIDFGAVTRASAQYPDLFSTPQISFVDAHGIPIYSSTAFTIWSSDEITAEAKFDNVGWSAGRAGEVNGRGQIASDTAVFQAWENRGTIVAASARLDYQMKVKLAMIGPFSSSPGNSITLSASASNYTGPLQYRWYRNGVQVGSGSSYSAYFVNAGSYTYTLRVTDVHGDQGEATRTISVSTSGGGGSDPCAGGIEPRRGRPEGDSTTLAPGPLPPAPSFAEACYERANLPILEGLRRRSSARESAGPGGVLRVLL
jgi:hypothetical protein